MSPRSPSMPGGHSNKQVVSNVTVFECRKWGTGDYAVLPRTIYGKNGVRERRGDRHELKPLSAGFRILPASARSVLESIIKIFQMWRLMDRISETRAVGYGTNVGPRMGPKALCPERVVYGSVVPAIPRACQDCKIYARYTKSPPAFPPRSTDKSYAQKTHFKTVTSSVMGPQLQLFGRLVQEALFRFSRCWSWTVSPLPSGQWNHLLMFTECIHHHSHFQRTRFGTLELDRPRSQYFNMDLKLSSLPLSPGDVYDGCPQIMFGELHSK